MVAAGGGSVHSLYTAAVVGVRRQWGGGEGCGWDGGAGCGSGGTSRVDRGRRGGSCVAGAQISFVFGYVFIFGLRAFPMSPLACSVSL